MSNLMGYIYLGLVVVLAIVIVIDIIRGNGDSVS